MAAPTLQALFDFEGNFEKAGQAVLQASGINAYVAQQQQQLPPISTGIYLDVGPAYDQLTFLPLGGQAVQSEQDFFRYNATLGVEISVSRDKSPLPASGSLSFLAQVRGLVRAAFMQSQWPFYDTNLPYYRVSQIRPDGTVNGFEQRRNVDLVTLRFSIDFAIQPTAWPIGFPPT